MDRVTIWPGELCGEIDIPPSKSLLHRAILCAALSDGESNISNLILSDDVLATLGALPALGASIEQKENYIRIKGGARRPDPAGKVIGSADSDISLLQGHNMQTKDGKIGNKGSWDMGKTAFGTADEEISLRVAPWSESPAWDFGKDGVCVDAGESGSTLRFLIPLLLSITPQAEIHGSRRLFKRGLIPYFDLMDRQKIRYRQEEDRLYLQGRLQPDRFSIPGNISSQFITGLLLALPRLSGDSEIIVEGMLESRGYVDLTLDMLCRYGVTVENDGYRRFHIPGGQRFQCCDYRAEGDFSQAAFFLVADALGSRVDCRGLFKNSLQGDREILQLLSRCGALIEWGKDGLLCRKEQALSGVCVDASQIPDLVPVLAVLLALCRGESRIVNAGRLRIKESDRLHTTTLELRKLGADIDELEDGLIIRGVERFTGACVQAHNDHRIAMALTVAALSADGPVTLEGSSCVKKSWPQFFKIVKRLGGRVE